MSGVPLYTVAQVRAFDRMAIEAHGIDGYELMRRAAQAAFDLLRRRWPSARRIAVVCGSGNNGGDGYVLARLAQAAGFAAHVVALDPPRARSDAARALRDWFSAGGAVLAADAALPDADVVVDAIFGTGLTRAAAGDAAHWIERISAVDRPVLALDVPSGIDADTGAAAGPAIRAAATATFVARKRGLHTGAAMAHCGEIVLDALGIPPAVFAAAAPDAHLLDRAAMRAWLPPRAADVHKGNFGHVLAVGGDHGMGGAIRLAGEAALRVGAGLVGIATRGEHVGALNAARPELMAQGIEGPQELAAQIERATVLAVGPGLGRRAWGHALWHAALASRRPAVLDADALNLLASEPVSLRSGCVLTPHPGEAARLLGTTPAAINADRFAAARALAARHAATVVLKGAGSLIANPDGVVAVCPWGNPGMASGGMGDVLTGVIAGLLAQGMAAWEAACCGVALHALAGDAAARAGQAGTLATDLFAPLRALRNGLDTR